MLSPEEEFALTSGEHGHPEKEGYGMTKVSVATQSHEHPLRREDFASALQRFNGHAMLNPDKSAVPMPRPSSSSAISRTSKSACSTSTASCAANTCRARNSCPRSRAASASATSCWAGTARTSSTTTCKFTGWHTGYPDAPVRILPDIVPAAAVRGRRAVLPQRVRARPPSRFARAALLRRVLERAQQAWASRRTPASSTKCSSSMKRRIRCARRTIAI